MTSFASRYVTGTNNDAKQVSKDHWNNTLADIATAIDSVAVGVVKVADRTALAAVATPSGGDLRYLAESGRTGMFRFDASNLSAKVTIDTRQAVYVPPSSDTTGTSGAWVRQWDGKELPIEWFGAIADYNGTTGTDNYAAIIAAIDFVRSSSAYENISPTILFGYGTKEIGTAYYVGQTLNVTTKCHLKGLNSGHNSSGLIFDSELVWPANTICIVNHNSNTSGSTGAEHSAQGSIYEGLTISQVTQGADTTKHGFWMRSTSTLVNCVFRNIAGNPINIVGQLGAGGDTEGDCNNWRVIGCFVHGCGGNALHVDGNDANAGYCEQFVTHGTVSGCGIYDNASFNNTYIAPQITAYGNGGVTHSGKHWQLIVASDTGTTPGTDATIWYDLGTGSVDANYPAWSGATTYRARLPILIVRGNALVLNPYQEGGTGVLSYGPSATFIGGNMTTTPDTPHLRPVSANGPLLSGTGVGGYIAPSAGTALATSCGTYAYTEVGVENDLVADGRPHLLKHSVQAVSSGNPLYWRWNGEDQWFNYLNQSPYWVMTGPATAVTFGRSTAQPYYMAHYDLGLIDPDNSANARIIGIRDAAPTTGYHAVGEFFFSTAAAVLGYRCAAAGTPGTWEIIPTRLAFNPIGYITGNAVGGGVVQATDKSTGVTLNKATGYITMNGAALAANTAVSFTLTNSLIAAGDVPQVVISQAATAGAYAVQVDAVANGSCRISLRNLTGGSLSEAVVLNFVLVKGSYD